MMVSSTSGKITAESSQSGRSSQEQEANEATRKAGALAKKTGQERGSFVARGNSIIARTSAIRRSSDAVRVNVYEGSLRKVQVIAQELVKLKQNPEKNGPEIERFQAELREAKESLNEAATTLLKTPHELDKMMQKYHHLIIEIFSEADTFAGLDDNQSQKLIDEWVADVCKSSENRMRASQIISALIQKDVAFSQNEELLFRVNTIRTKLYTAFQTEMLKPLMQECVKASIEAIIQKPEELVKRNQDPQAGITPGIPNEIANIDVITLYSTRFFDHLNEQLQKQPLPIPKEMKAIYSGLSLAVKSKFPQADFNTHVTSFLFLRGINPTLTTPSRLGLNIAMNAQQVKNVLAVSIAIQNVVNNAVEVKGKWDDALKKPKHPTELSYVASMQPALKKIGIALQRGPVSQD